MYVYCPDTLDNVTHSGIKHKYINALVLFHYKTIP